VDGKLLHGGKRGRGRGKGVCTYAAHFEFGLKMRKLQLVLLKDRAGKEGPCRHTLPEEKKGKAQGPLTM